MGRSLLAKYGLQTREPADMDDVKQNIRDIRDWANHLPLGGFGCVLKRSTNDAAVANGANTAITFDTAVRDRENWWKRGSSNTLYVPRGGEGVYVLQGQVVLTAAALGAWYVSITVNGTAVAHGMGNATLDRVPDVSAFVPLSVGDAIQLLVVNRSGAAITPLAFPNATAATPFMPSLHVWRLTQPPQQLENR